MTTKKHTSIQEFDAFMSRLWVAYERRAAAGTDPADAAAVLAHLKRVVTTAEAFVQALRRDGFSWQEIADGLGTSKQAAQQRWGGRRVNPGTHGQLQVDGQNDVNDSLT